MSLIKMFVLASSEKLPPKSRYLTYFIMSQEDNKDTRSKNITVQNMTIRRRKRQNEAAIVTLFSTSMHARFYELSRNGKVPARYVGIPLGGQDRELADFLAAANGRFVIVEFKDNEKLFMTELKKPLREKLCQAYLDQSDLLDMGKQLHYAGWGTERITQLDLGQDGTEEFVAAGIKLDRYPFRLCAARIPGFSIAHSRMCDSEKFIEDFFGSKLIGGRGTRFKRYVETLYKIAGKNTESGIQDMSGLVFIYVPATEIKGEISTAIKFQGLEDLYRLTTGHEKQKTQERELGIQMRY